MNAQSNCNRSCRSRTRNFGKALAAVGRGTEADDAFKIYFDSDPDRKEIMRGVELQKEGEIEEATKAYLGVLERNPNSVNAMRHLAVVYWAGVWIGSTMPKPC